MYSVPNTAGATFAWTLTGGDGSINGATNLNSVTVDWINTGGDLEVTITGPVPNNCVTVSSVTVAISAISPPPNNGNGNIAHVVCQDSGQPSLDANTSGAAVAVKWYSDAGLGTQIGTGNPFIPAVADLDMAIVGITTFYVTQDIGCAESTPIEYAITIEPKAVSGTATDQSVCNLDTNFDLFNGLAGHQTTGTWNDDDATGALSGAQNEIFDATFAGLVTGQTYNFTYTVLGVASCVGLDASTTLKVTISGASSTPPTDINPSDPVTACLNATAPTISVTGTSVKWYSDAALTNEVKPGSGSNLDTDGLVDMVVAGTTSFYATQDSGCGESGSTEIKVEVTALPNATITGNNAACENATEIYSVADAGVGATYTWTVNGTPSFSGETTNSLTVNWATVNGDVQVDIINAATCAISSAVFTVSISATSPPPNSGNNIAEDVCQDATLPSLDANTSGTVTWFSDAGLTTQIGTGNPFTPTAADLDMTTGGITAFYVTQNVGCGESTTAIEYVVTVLAKPDATIAGNGSICENTSGEIYTVPLDAAATYAWILTGGDGTITAGATTNSVTVDWLATGGDLQVTVTGAAPTNCPSVSTLAVVVAAQPAEQTINEADQSICENATIAISLENSETGVTYELLVDGTATGVSKDGDGTTNFIIGALGPNEGLVGAGSPHTVAVQASINGGCLTILTDIVEVAVTANPVIQTIVEAGTVVICEAAGQVVTIANSEATVNYEIILDGTVTNVSALGTGNSNFEIGTLTAANGLTVGNHIITVQASLAACTTTFTDQIDVTVQDVSSPPAEDNSSNPVMACQNGPAPTISVVGSGVTWYKEAGLNTVLGTGTSFTPASADLDMTVNGTTSFFATQDEGCGESTATEIRITIENCSGCYTVELNLSDATCTDDNGEITLVVGANGVSPFDYEITNTATGNSVSQNGQPNTTFTFSGVASGNYTYLVRDATACEVTGALDIGIKEFGVIATVSKAGDIACFGDPTGGTARITVEGGVNPYQYKIGNDDWTDFASGDVIEGLPAGVEYVILVRDNASDGCPSSSKISISEPAAVEAEVVKISDTYPEQNIGSISVTDITSDNPPYEIQLLDGDGFIIEDFITVEPDRFGKFNFLFEQLTIGAYVVVVRDKTGCDLALDEIFIESKSDITIPNVFTPNNDGVNEAFIILNKKANTTLVVVNRWGIKIFESEDYQNDWRAEGVPDAIYFYTISMDGQLYNGSVEVWRGGAKINN